MIVLDAGVLIAHLVDSDAHASAAYDILDTEDELVLHPITLAESMVGPVRVQREQEAIDIISALGVETLTWRDDEPLALARLRARTGLKLPDCCVLASALRHDATLATFDARLASAAQQSGVQVAGIPAG